MIIHKLLLTVSIAIVMATSSFALESVKQEKHCAINKKQLIGYWKSSGDNGFFQEFLIDDDGTFASWLHQRPEVNGTWSLDNCVFTIEGTMGFKLRVVSFKNKKLTLYDMDDNSTSVYRWTGKPDI
jgi:hypothetical protein